MSPPSGRAELPTGEEAFCRQRRRGQKVRSEGEGTPGIAAWMEAPECECPEPLQAPDGADGGSAWAPAAAPEGSWGLAGAASPRTARLGVVGGQEEVQGRRSCIAGGKRPQESDFEHCPTPQTFVRCGPHHRAELCILPKEDIKRLHDIWWTYRDDLTWPWFEKKPVFSDEDFAAFRDIGQKVVDAMVEEYRQPMVLDQATISNTNHIGHPPHADNVQFDSVWWKGKRIRVEDEVIAAQDGAYVLWRQERTSYRSYSCSVSLTDPNDFEGGEVQFFDRFGDKDPVARYKCAEGCGIAFCGCQRNIHAVTGVTRGFRLVFLVWTRPPDVRVPDSQMQVCYFRPGTGLGVWLTTAELLRRQAVQDGTDSPKAWMPLDDDDGTCTCNKCSAERKKLAWKDRTEAFCLNIDGSPNRASSAAPTPTTSAGNSPRTSEQPASESQGSDVLGTLRYPPHHCPHQQASVQCDIHELRELNDVLDAAEVRELHVIWKKYRDDLSSPWYDKKPEFDDVEFESFRRAAQKVVDAMAEQYQQPLTLDQATISCTNHLGHPPHADNVQFDSVWWHGRQVRQRDELVAARGGAEVLWKEVSTSYRNYSASISLTNPWQYGSGELEFYNEWGEVESSRKYKCHQGNGVAYCGCQRSIHAVTGVKWGFRLVLLIWTRPPHVPVPRDQAHVCYFRPGTGPSVWLTAADLESYPARQQAVTPDMPDLGDLKGPTVERGSPMAEDVTQEGDPLPDGGEFGYELEEQEPTDSLQERVVAGAPA